jgi:hypothetical protein
MDAAAPVSFMRGHAAAFRSCPGVFEAGLGRGPGAFSRAALAAERPALTARWRPHCAADAPLVAPNQRRRVGRRELYAITRAPPRHPRWPAAHGRRGHVVDLWPQCWPRTAAQRCQRCPIDHQPCLPNPECRLRRHQHCGYGSMPAIRWAGSCARCGPNPASPRSESLPGPTSRRPCTSRGGTDHRAPREHVGDRCRPHACRPPSAAPFATSTPCCGCFGGAAASPLRVATTSCTARS